MARVGLFYKTAGIETGGTNDLTGLMSGGTLVSVGDTEVTPLSLPEVGTVYTAYFRMIGDADELDPGIDSVEHIAFDPPAGLQACATWNGTFVDQLETAVHATGGFQPVYLKPSGTVVRVCGRFPRAWCRSGGQIPRAADGHRRPLGQPVHGACY